jgi:ABC-2 type transport system permease protein
MIKQYFAKPGTLPWLLKYEIIFAWRGLGRKSITGYAVLLSGAWILIHLGAYAMLYGFAKASESGVTLPPRALTYTGIAFWIFFTLLLSQTLAHAVNAFFSRGDLDLLLSSPINPRYVLMVRGIGIGLSALTFPILLLLPFAHVGLIAGKPQFIAIYPAIISLALLAAAVGIWLTMSLVKMFGARRAKVFAQILGALIGAGAFIITQSHNLLSRETRSALATWFNSNIETGGALAGDSLLWWPVRAFMGETVPLIAFILFSAGLFWLVTRLTYRRFVAGTQESTDTGAGRQKSRDANDHVKYASGFWGGMTIVMLKKEWRLIIRDPQIITQTLLQLLYLLPMLFLSISGRGASTFLIPSIVVIVAMLVGNLAWLTVAAEDAPDLVGTAPIAMNRMRVIKGLAAIVPPVLMILPLVIYWLGKNPWHSLILLCCATGAAISSAACYILNPRKANRREMAQRGKAHVVSTILELLGAMGWGATALGLILIASKWWIIVIALPLALSGIIYSYMAGYEARRAGVLA